MPIPSARRPPSFRIFSAAERFAETPEKDGSTRATLKWNGRILRLYKERGIWRLRTTTKDFRISCSLRTGDLIEARKIAREVLSTADTGVTKGTLEQVALVYLKSPKKCRDDCAKGNVSRLKSLVEFVYGDGTPLSAVAVSELPDLWVRFIAKKQGREVPDYTSRRAANSAINSQLRQAVSSIFRKKLLPHYRKAGICLPDDAGVVEFLPESHRKPTEADDDALCEAWEALRTTDLHLWLVIGLARFCGLRRDEIANARGSWFARKGSGVYCQLKDREEDGHWTKTGREYKAPVMHPILADYLAERAKKAPDAFIIERPDRDRWIEREPQEWVRPFVGKTPKPLHRLRGLYADHIAREMGEAIAARQAAIKAASSALGHTTTKTTVDHYLGDD